MDDQMANLEVVGENLRWYLHIYINNKSYCLSKDNPSFNIELSQGKHTMIVKKEKLSLNFLKIMKILKMLFIHKMLYLKMLF